MIETQTTYKLTLTEEHVRQLYHLLQIEESYGRLYSTRGYSKLSDILDELRPIFNHGGLKEKDT